MSRHFFLCHFVVVNSLDGWNEDVAPLFESVMATVERLVFLDFLCVRVEKRELSFAWLVSFCSFSVTDAPALVMRSSQ